MDSVRWFVFVQSLSHVRLFVTLWIAARQTSLSSAISWSLLKIMSIESVIPSNHLILCRPLLLPSIFASISPFQWVSSPQQVAKVLELQLQHHCGGRKISERAVGERDSQGKHGKKFGRWMAIEKERRKKISLFAKLVISVSFVPVLRCLWMNWGKWLEQTAKQRASQPASLLGNFKPPLQRRLGFSSKGHVFKITALPSHPFSNLEQHRGDWKWDEQLGAWKLSAR